MPNDESKRKIQLLQDLKNHNGWHLLVEDMQKAVEYIDKVILWDIDVVWGQKMNREEMNEKLWTKYDLLRAERQKLKALIKLPDDMLKQLDWMKVITPKI